MLRVNALRRSESPKKYKTEKILPSKIVDMSGPTIMYDCSEKEVSEHDFSSNSFGNKVLVKPKAELRGKYYPKKEEKGYFIDLKI